MLATSSHLPACCLPAPRDAHALRHSLATHYAAACPNVSLSAEHVFIATSSSALLSQLQLAVDTHNASGNASHRVRLRERHAYETRAAALRDAEPLGGWNLNVHHIPFPQSALATRRWLRGIVPQRTPRTHSVITASSTSSPTLSSTSSSPPSICACISQIIVPMTEPPAHTCEATAAASPLARVLAGAFLIFFTQGDASDSSPSAPLTLLTRTFREIQRALGVCVSRGMQRGMQLACAPWSVAAVLKERLWVIAVVRHVLVPAMAQALEMPKARRRGPVATCEETTTAGRVANSTYGGCRVRERLGWETLAMAAGSGNANGGEGRGDPPLTAPEFPSVVIECSHAKIRDRILRALPHMPLPPGVRFAPVCQRDGREASHVVLVAFPATSEAVLGVVRMAMNERLVHEDAGSVGSVGSVGRGTVAECPNTEEFSGATPLAWLSHTATPAWVRLHATEYANSAARVGRMVRALCTTSLKAEAVT